MKKIVLFIAMAMFLITGMSYAQVGNTIKDAIIKPKPAIEAKKKELHMPKREMNSKAKVSTAEINNPNAPVIAFETLAHDYGTFMQGGDGVYEFKFKNEGKEPLILNNVRSSCGCTIPTWPKHPIMPGESEVIKVKYDTKRVGAFHKSIYVYSNAKKPTVTLKITGKINKDPNAPVKTKKKAIHSTKPIVGKKSVSHSAKPIIKKK